MRTTLNLNDDVLKAVQKLTQAPTKSRAVTQALEEYVRLRKQRELKGLSGKIKLRLSWKALEQEELSEESAL